LREVVAAVVLVDVALNEAETTEFMANNTVIRERIFVGTIQEQCEIDWLDKAHVHTIRDTTR
jgi:hypothetical protein